MRLTETLFYRDRLKYAEVENRAIVELQKLRKNHRIKDDIFRLLRSLGDLHLLRFPIADDQLCASTLKRKDHYFVYLNTSQPLEKQIFAAAHELYHYLYDRDFWKRGELLTEVESQFTSQDENELIANGFAACFLVPKNHLDDELSMMNINIPKIDLLDLVKLMDAFAVPFKTIVLRLHETGYLDRPTTESFLQIEDRNPERGILPLIHRTGYALRWQVPSEGEQEYGRLLELANRNLQHAVDSYRDLADRFTELGLDVRRVLEPNEE